MTKYPSEDRLDAVATAVAHAGRRRVLARLADGPASSSELAARIDVTLPTLHRHLQVLDTAGLLDSRKSGRVVTHRLVPAPLTELGDWLAARTSFWSHQLDALGAAVSSAPDPAASANSEEGSA